MTDQRKFAELVDTVGELEASVLAVPATVRGLPWEVVETGHGTFHVESRVANPKTDERGYTVGAHVGVEVFVTPYEGWDAREVAEQIATLLNNLL